MLWSDGSSSEENVAQGYAWIDDVESGIDQVEFDKIQYEYECCSFGIYKFGWIFIGDENEAILNWNAYTTLFCSW